jgi:hypothetical protein
MVITVGKKSCKLIIVTNEEYGLLGKPLKKSIVTTKKGEIEYAQIKKENLSLEKYQRPVDKKRVEKMNKNWIPECGTIFVYEHKIDGKYYYTIPDGQHRACANPNDTVACIKMRSDREMLPVDIFLTVNRNSAKVTSDDMFWAEVYKENSLAIWMLDYLRHKWDMTMVRQSAESRSDGSFCFADLLFKELNRLVKANDEEIAKEYFETLCECMLGKFDITHFQSRSNCYKGYISVWQGMIKLLEHKSWPDSEYVLEKLDSMYDREEEGPPDKIKIATPQQISYHGSRDFHSFDQKVRAYSVLLNMWNNHEDEE